MKKAVILLMLSVLVVALTSCWDANRTIENVQNGTNSASEAVQPVDANKDSTSATVDKNVIELEGAINKDLKIHMNIQIKDGKVEGSYYYDKYQTNIPLKGSIDINRMIDIKEYDQTGAVTGTFDGWYTPGIRIEGDWINEKTKAIYPFKLSVLNGTGENAVWGGEWKRINTGRFDASNLVIFNETHRDFEFQIDACSGGHMGFIDGKAEVTGSRAIYRDAETGAEMSFVLGDGIITVKPDDRTNNLAGAGVIFDGEYKKGELDEEYTILSLGMVETSEQEAEFKRLVSEDVTLFLDTAQFSTEEEDLDGYGARVKRFWVRGLARSNESIIMLMPDSRFCAAVIDPANEFKVKVYTNAGYIDRVPKTIEKWRENFKDFKVEFIRKP